jgi:hypothetical protein
MKDGWESFCRCLQEEAQALQRLNAAAVHLTAVLVDGSPEAIVESDRAVNATRALYQSASAKRRGMQARGFGSATLPQVCRYAPRQAAPYLYHSVAQINYYSIALDITVKNNKTLIAAGLERITKITQRLQECASGRTGVYKRRGFVAPPSASVLVSNSV